MFAGKSSPAWVGLFNVSNPYQIPILPVDQNTFTSGTVMDLAVQEHFLYVVIFGGIAGEGFNVIDIEDPNNIRVVGGFEESFFEDFVRNGGAGFGFSDMFNQRYGNFSGKGSNVNAQVYITLKEAYLGTKKEIRLGTKTVSINIGAGVKPGQKMRLKGLGQRGMTEEHNGDLILTVLIQDDPNFYLDQKGLHTIKHINLYDALLGTKDEIQVFDKTITYTIPKCVRNGTMLRIKGKGFPNYHNPSTHGDFFVNIFVDIPPSLTEEQEELVKKIKDLDNG